MNVPKVSVVMAVFNQMNQTALNQAVDSILGQTLRDFEFLIYDDGSIPEAADYIRKQEEKDSRIRVCGSRENHGLGFSLNVCADMALGRYIARMDADDIAVPERLAEQYDFLEREERYDWCGSNAFLYAYGAGVLCQRFRESMIFSVSLLISIRLLCTAGNCLSNFTTVTLETFSAVRIMRFLCGCTRVASKGTIFSRNFFGFGRIRTAIVAGTFKLA